MANATKETTITLKLTEEEAEYLIALTQNYLGGHIEGEDIATSTIRESIFTALQGLTGSYALFSSGSREG